MKIRLSSVKNIRDFSEYGYGNRIRSAHLNGLTRSDAEILVKKHGLTTVIDLRTPKEVEEKPDFIPEGVTYLHIPIFDEAVPGISHESADSPDGLRRSIPDMAKLYRALATEEPYVGNFGKVLGLITDRSEKGTILWHCTEGKDRCGIVSALFLLSLGVGRDEIIRDYLMTNRVNRAKASKYYFLILLSGRGRKFAAMVRDAFIARREYLEPVLDDLEKLTSEK